jgi:hypothetical protein
MIAAAILIAAWGTAFVSGDPLGYAVRLSSEPFGHALLHPPVNKYLIAVPLIIYKGMFETFGLGSYAPYRVVGIALVLLCSGLLFLLLRRRVGDLLAVPPAVLMLFFGPGSSVVLTPDRLPSQIALAAGLAMILALEREERRGDVAAAILLLISLASHPVGVAFAAAATVMILLRLPPDRFRSLWIVAIPGALFAVWYLFVRSPDTATGVSTGPGDILGFVGDSWAALTAAVSGLFGILDAPAFEEPLGWIAAVLLVGLIAVGVWRWWWRLPTTFWAALVGLLVLMAATRLSPAGFTRVPDEPRYLYPEAFLLLLALGNLGAAVPRRSALWLASGILIISLWPSIDLLHDEGQTLRIAGDRVRARLAAIEIAGHNAQPDFKAAQYTPTAGDYLEATDAYGGAGFPPAELASQSPSIRLEADRALVGALGLELERAPVSRPERGLAPRLLLGSASGAAGSARGCVKTDSTHAEVVLRSSGVWIGSKHLQEARLNLGRFADQAFTPVPLAQGARAATLRIPRDTVKEPWRLGIDSHDPVRVCGDLRRASPQAFGFPRGWQVFSTQPDLRLFDCLHAPTGEAAGGGIVATGPRRGRQLLVLTSEISWPSAGAADRSAEALRERSAGRCIETTTESALRNIGIAASVSARRAPAPRSGGKHAIVYSEAFSTAKVTNKRQGALASLTDGSDSVLISALSVSGQPFPSKLVSRLVEGAANRLSRSAQKSR